MTAAAAAVRTICVDGRSYITRAPTPRVIRAACDTNDQGRQSLSVLYAVPISYFDLVIVSCGWSYWCLKINYTPNHISHNDHNIR